MKVGEKYYFVAHAYYHFLGEVMEMDGPRCVRFKNVRQIISCKRDWTSFFAEGCKDDTVFHEWLDGSEFDQFIAKSPWPHDIPSKKKAHR